MSFSNATRGALVAAAVLVSTTSAQAHLFHVSLAEIEFNASSRVLEVALQVHPEHFETALSQEARRVVRLDSTQGVDSLIQRYLRDRFVVRGADGDSRGHVWVGKEVAVKTAWLYFEVPLGESFDGVTLENSILFSPGNRQVNTVNFRAGRFRKSFTFSRQDPSHRLRAPAGLERSLLTAAVAPAPERRVHEFDKLHLTEQFFCEGAHFADLDEDGDVDVFSGPYWYEGPEFRVRHEIYAPQPYDPQGYSRNFLTYSGDFNGDGWVDIFHVGFPGEESPWFENPKGAAGHWKRHIAIEKTDNESPILVDITRDGVPELVFHTGGRYGYATPNPTDPTALWTFHAVSEKQAGGRFEHGIGYGDVDGDGRIDLLTKHGWYGQPESLAGDPLWTYHPVPFAPGQGGSQMYAYDFDGDGDNDVITVLEAHGWGLVWYENRPTAAGIEFRQHTIVGRKPEDNPWGVCFTQMHAVDLVDMDGDGVLDIVTGKRFWAHNGHDPEGNEAAVLYWMRTARKGPGDVEFVPYLIDDNSGVGTQVAAGDVNGDGLADIVVGNKKGTFVFLHSAREVDEAEWERAQPKRRP